MVKKDKETLRDRFDKRGFAVSAYARAYGVDHGILSKVLQGKLDGTKAHRGGDARKIIAQLKKDKVWIGKLPWIEHPTIQKVA